MGHRETRLLNAIVAVFGRNVITLFGASLTTVSAALVIIGILLVMSGVTSSPYDGIIAFMVLPAFFVMGLIIIPLGALWEKWRGKKQGGSTPGKTGPYPVFDFNTPKVRHGFVIVGFLTVLNFFIISTVTYQGIVYTDSVKFCGQVCHTIMTPEYTAYRGSPHSRVKCVDCHIGPGATWFVRYKFDGARQVVATVLNTYPRPIPSPVETLRPARETCEECHWPAKFTGDLLKEKTRYSEDEANTPLKTLLLMHIGGGDSSTPGIHSWHIDPRRNTQYYATDRERQKIAVVRVTAPDGTIKEFIDQGSGITREQAAGLEMRTMDCIDCHNRPTHIYEMPADAMDKAMAQGRIDASLPFIKAAGLDALNGAKGEAGDLDKIADSVRTFYQKDHADVFQARQVDVDKAIIELQAIYSRNVFPDMNVTWGTYPNNLGHTETSGCFRCHDDSHATQDGKTIPQDCMACHAVLAWNDPDPDIAKQLGGGK